MALMFQRLARNYIKNGYFPTDGETISRVLNLLDSTEVLKPLRLFDPCCGEGVALAEVNHFFKSSGYTTETYAIEYDVERAKHAKTLLDYCVQADIQDCVIGKRQFGLMFHNPPYGDLVSDQHRNSNLSHDWKGRKRLEKLFYALTNASLQFGGILIYIIPYTCIDEELAIWIAKHFTDVEVYLAPEQRFKQLVIIGKRKRSSEYTNWQACRDKLLACRETLPDELPKQVSEPRYFVPGSDDDVKLYSVNVDSEQLQECIENSKSLWSNFSFLFTQEYTQFRQPLQPFREWHMALALAAGQVSGLIESESGQKLLVKGDTVKEKNTQTVQETDETGNTTITRINTDKFVPIIRGLVMNRDADNYGDVVVIQ